MSASFRRLALAGWLMGQAWVGAPSQAAPIWSAAPKDPGIAGVEAFANLFWNQQLITAPSTKPALAWSAIAAADGVAPVSWTGR